MSVLISAIPEHMIGFLEKLEKYQDSFCVCVSGGEGGGGDTHSK